MFDPVTIGLGIVAYLTLKNRGETSFGQLTPEREEIYKNAMEHLTDPRRMMALAEKFQQEGLKIQAYLLRERAKWRSRPEPLRKQHEAIFHQALASTNIEGIARVAAAFEAQTATGMANALRGRIQFLQDQALAKAREEAAKAAEQQAKATADKGDAKKETNGAAPHVEIVSKDQGPQDKVVA